MLNRAREHRRTCLKLMFPQYR